MSIYIELNQKPDWSNDRSIAFDLDPKLLYGANLNRWERVFVPKSQALEDSGRWYVSDWILDKKQEEFVSKGFDKSNVFLAFSSILGSKRIEREIQSGIDVSLLRDWFDKAASNLQTPKVLFAVDGEVLKFARKGKRAKVPGVVDLTNGEEWGDANRKWYGTIRRDGKFTPSRDCTDKVKEVVVDFAKDPAAYVLVAQRQAGNCCFCRNELSTERSREVGYGPTCAKNYGLNW